VFDAVRALPSSLSHLLRALSIAGALALSVGLVAAANAPPPNAPPAAAVDAQPPPAPPAADPPPATVLLLLPAPNSPFARAADAVRQGFLAAQAASPQPMTVRVLEIDDDSRQLPRALADARAQGVDVIAGPLARAQVNATMKAEISAPMVTLSLPDTDALAPAPMLVFGLSVEQEARVLVRAALATLAPARAGARTAPRFVLLTGEGALARRAAAAFRDALREAGERATAIAVDLRYDSLQEIGDRVFRAEADAVFLALDAREAAIVRPRLAHDLRLFATSQVHLGGAEGLLLAHDLDGVHFVDVPWLLEPDHPAVMVHAQPPQPLSAELSRLYALGIDAYRLADLWRTGRARFELDGVTGALRVDRAARARVERWPVFAVYRHGRVERLHVPPPAAWP
jgi:outer membrane PBP1 activator LpoA protein